MMEKINRWTIAAYTSATSFISDFKNDERGLSGVVVAVLLILVAVLIITMLWGSLSEWLGQLWDKITGAGDGITGSDSFG